MPYKHIAAHLNKTDLACRLHYYQIHGNRRKRNLSCSSMPGSLAWDHHVNSLPPSPPESAVTSAPGSPKNGLQGLASAHDVHLPPILPRASSVESTGSRFPSVEEARRVPLPPLAAPRPQAAAAATPSSAVLQKQEALRLDTSYPTLSNGQYQYHDASHVDLGRLQSVYARHGPSFWTAVAAEYGAGASPAALEQAWRTNSCCQPAGRPITPGESPMSISSIVSLAAEKHHHHSHHHNPWERVPEERALA